VDNQVTAAILSDLGTKAFDDVRPALNQAMDLANMVYPSGAQTVLMMVGQRMLTMVALSVVAQDSTKDQRSEMVARAMTPDSLLFASLLLSYQPEISGPDPIAWAHGSYEKLRGKPFEYASGPYALGSGLPTHVVRA